jgi:putative DNA primase/helicase
MSSNTLDAVLDYHSHGWFPIPVPAGQKKPVIEGWQNLRITKEDLPTHFSNGANVGLLLGNPSANLTDIDLDWPEARAMADEFLPETHRISGRKGAPRSHYFYTVEPLAKTKKYEDPTLRNEKGERAMIVELRSTGAQTIVPPSRHPSGEDYIWHEEGEAATVSLNLLQTSVSTLAACAIASRHWQEGKRHDSALALSGILLRAGWTIEKTEHFIITAATVAQDDEIEDRRQAVKYTAEQLKTGRPTTGIPRLIELLSRDVAERIIKWLGIQNGAFSVESETATRPEDFTDWIDPEPLPTGLLPVPAFCCDLLPEPFAPWIMDIAERMQCPLDYPAVGAIVALASLVGNQISIRPKRHDDWIVVPNLFGAIVGRPGVLKSPALDEVMKPLNRLMVEARKAYEQDLREWEIDRITAEAKRDKLKDEIKKAIKNDSGMDKEYYRAQLEEIESLIEPTERRYIINDSTVEKVGELLNRNPRGLLLFRDELTGWLRSLDKEGHESDRAFYLEAWNGKSGFTYDRIGRGTLHIKRVTLSVLGGIQPGPLASYLRHALSGGQGDDGLLQRFQLMVYPDISPDWRNVDHYPDTKDKNKAFEIFRKLGCIDAAQLGAAIPEEATEIAYLRFDEEAQELFDSWRADLEKDVRRERIEHPALEAHQSKYRSLMPSLALLFHLIDKVDGERETAAVSLDSAAKAAAWCTYLLEHAKRVYGMVANASANQARLLIEKIKSGALKDTFTARDVYRNQWAGLTTASETAEPLSLLEDFGWLRSVAVKSPPLGGRPTVHYIVNPKVKAGR